MKWFASACLLAMSLASADVYRHVDENGNVSYTDQPPNIEQAQAQSEAKHRRRERERLGIQAQRVSATEREHITAKFQAAKKQLEKLEKKKLATCGEQPRGGFAGFGPKRDRHIAYDECERNFKGALEKAGQQLQSARRNYLSME